MFFKKFFFQDVKTFFCNVKTLEKCKTKRIEKIPNAFNQWLLIKNVWLLNIGILNIDKSFFMLNFEIHLYYGNGDIIIRMSEDKSGRDNYDDISKETLILPGYHG